MRFKRRGAYVFYHQSGLTRRHPGCIAFQVGNCDFVPGRVNTPTRDVTIVSVGLQSRFYSWSPVRVEEVKSEMECDVVHGCGEIPDQQVETPKHLLVLLYGALLGMPISPVPGREAPRLSKPYNSKKD